MQVSVETGEGLERKLTVQVPSDQIDSQIEARLKSMAPRIKLDGFRPGKVPMKIVRQKYLGEVKSEVLGELIEKSYRDAVMQEKLRPAGMPSIDPKELQDGQPFEYTATFEIYPEIEMAPMETLAVEKDTAEISDTDVDNMIETLRKQRTNWQTVERAAADGDQVTVDFEGFVDDVAFEGGQAENVPVTIGSGSMIPGFEEQLKGLKSGDETKIKVTFPDDYAAKELAAKEATFNIVVKSVAESSLPELDAEFAKSFGVEDGDLDKLKSDIRNNMERELSNNIAGMLKARVMDALIAANDIQIPKALIDQEISHLQQQAQQQYGQNVENMPRDVFEKDAERRVKLGLLVGKIIDDNDIKLDKDKVQQKIADAASQYDDPQMYINYYNQNKQLMASIEALVMEDMVVDWIAEHAKVTEVAKTFDDVMKPGPAS